MLQCSSCGSNLRPTARICIKCGHAVTDEERKQALQLDAASSTTTSVAPIYSANPTQTDTAPASFESAVNKAPVFSSPVGEIISSPTSDQAPVFSSPVGEIASSVNRPKGVSDNLSSVAAASRGQNGQQKKIVAIVVGVVFVVIFAFGLSSLMGKKEATAPLPASVATPAPVAPATPALEAPSEQKASSVIDLKNIRPVMAPAQTSGLLTDMLLNNSNSVKLLDLKARIEEIFPKPERGDRKAARALNDQALVAFRQENYQLAASLFADALKSDPSDIEVLNNYAYALLKGGRYPEAERILGSVLSIAPGRTSGWANLADVYANTNRPDAASAAFVVGFRFATNQDKALAFLKDRAESEPNENIKRAVINALAQLSQ